MPTTRRRLSLAAGALTLAVTLAACSGGAENNDADTQFAQMMVIHHVGAIEMADLAVERASTEEVRALAERITAAQGPEIELMTGWLEAWGEDPPGSTDLGGLDHSGMDHGGMDMDGMDQSEAMADVAALSGVEFDKRFLELMTAHHEGAVEMAEAVLADGAHPDALDLARSIIEAQAAEIAEMGGLLRGL